MIGQVLYYTLPAVRDLLPPEMMRSRRAWAMLLAIGLQESKFLARRQGSDGPARGFWQFERGNSTSRGGVWGVMNNSMTSRHAINVLTELRYEHLVGKVREVHYVIHDNDVLAAAFARLLLWTVPARLPDSSDPGAGWAQYLHGWHPGQPHPTTWDENFATAWRAVSAYTPTSIVLTD